MGDKLRTKNLHIQRITWLSYLMVEELISIRRKVPIKKGN